MGYVQQPLVTLAPPSSFDGWEQDHNPTEAEIEKAAALIALGMNNDKTGPDYCHNVEDNDDGEAKNDDGDNEDGDDADDATI